jgi:hypothetical protein
MSHVGEDTYTRTVNFGKGSLAMQQSWISSMKHTGLILDQISSFPRH